LTPKSDRFANSRSTGVVLHALHWGEAHDSIVVLLHGGGANAHWWDHIAPGLAGVHHVVALDFRGHGDSDHPDEQLAGAFNDDLEALLDQLGRKDVVLIGHSMGAHVALDHATRHSETRGLVLIDPSRGGGKRSRRMARLALLFRSTYRSKQEAVERYRFLPPSEHAAESLRIAIAEHSIRQEENGRWGFKFDPRWFGLPPRPRPDASRVACPTLVIRGSESSLLTPEGAAEWVAEMPHARGVEVAHAGHHVQIDRPEALRRLLREFIDLDVG
jgi:pimeloyl-ACP methyl ester carboxylesterase